MSAYGKNEFWEERYTKDPEPFDWYQRFSSLATFFEQHINNESQILNVGAGNSRLSEEMYDEGYANIVNIDFSQVAVSHMQQKYSDKPETFKYIHMDLLKQLQFEDKLFDCVLDKALIDCIFCGENSTTNVQVALKEISRVLKDGGTYICISYGTPDQRMSYLEAQELGWNVVSQTLPKPNINNSQVLEDDKDAANCHYLYICKKTQAEQQDQQ